MAGLALGVFAGVMGAEAQEVAATPAVKSPRAMALEAMEKSRHQDWDGAIEGFTKVIEASPNLPGAYLWRGQARMMKQDYNGSIQDFNQCLAVGRPAYEFYYYRGMAEARLNEYTAALADFQAALRLKPEATDTLCDRGMLRLKMEDPDGALADLNRAIAMDPKSTRSYFGRGLVHANRNEPQKAVADFQQAIALDPNNFQALNSLAWIYATDPALKAEDRVKGLALATRACLLTYGKRAEYLNTLAAACAAVGHYDAAIKWQNKYMEMSEGGPSAKARLELYRKHLPYVEPR